MIQGTSSDAGKSFLTTGLCRVFSDRGYKICPFKSQNMSNNSCVTADGLEMGRAQAVQAEAARLAPEVTMNPILLKPRRDTASEIVLMGRVFNVPADKDYYRTFTMNEGLRTVREALSLIESNFDAVLIEGAGSPAEINLNATEIVNMRIAREADVPVILVTDVDRGGSLAAIVGTLDLLGNDRDRVKGIVFNKFRGDISLFEPAIRWTEARTGIKVVGVMPWSGNIRIAGEDSLSIDWRGKRQREDTLRIGVVRLPYISNHTDLEAFEFESDVDLMEVDVHTSLHRLDAVILPGTKSSVRDMQYLWESGMAERLIEFHKAGGFLFGVCGGYQMLGQRIDDAYLRENDVLHEIAGLGLLPVVTTFEEEKTTVQSHGAGIHSMLSGIAVEGYEIHFGTTLRVEEKGDEIKRTFRPLFVLNGREDGMADPEFRVAGTYLHHIFHNDAFRTLWLNALRRSRAFPEKGIVDTTSVKEETYNALARQVEEHLDVDFLLKLSGF